MKRLVCCWELGANYGHITAFVALHRILHEQYPDIEMVLVLRTIDHAHTFVGDLPLRYFQAPFVRPQWSEPLPMYSYADLLLEMGWDKPSIVLSHVTAWRNLLHVLQPDLLLIDHGPTALLAARTLRIPAATFGSGFVIPPRTAPLPVFPVVRDPGPRSLDDDILTCVNGALAQFESPPLAALAELFAVEQEFLCTFPELDHYPLRPAADYWGPIYSARAGVVPCWPEGDGPRLFAYLQPTLRGLEECVAALGRVSQRVLVHIPGAATALLQRLQTPTLRIETRPLQMEGVLEQADLLVSHGGLGMAAQCLLAGKRHVVVPTQLEQRMLAKRLLDQQLAYAVDPEGAAPRWQETLERALHCPHLGRRVLEVRAAYADFSPVEQLQALADELAELMKRPA